MDIKHLSMAHFRNLGWVEEIQFPPGGLLVAAAPNAMGKTNFLESVVVLLRGRSWRTRVEECVAWGEDSFVLRGTVVGGDETRQIAVRYHRPSRKLRIEENGAPVSVVTFYAHYPLVLFLPEDTFLFSRGPSARRNFLNQALVTYPQYLSALVQYHRILKQRNRALKGAREADQIRSWTGLLGEQASVLWRHREGFVAVIDAQLTELYGRLSGEYRQFRAQLVPGAERTDDFVQELVAAWPQERHLGYTLYGPHRDDMVVLADGRPVRAALSRGQIRSLAIALKFIAHNYLAQISGEEPVLLLDDVLSELDDRRQRALIKNLPTTQTILTCTTLPAMLKERGDVYLLDLRSIIARAKLAPKLVEKKQEPEVVEWQQEEGAEERVAVG